MNDIQFRGENKGDLTMAKYDKPYIKIRITYVNYGTMEHKTVFISRFFEKSQSNAEEAIRLCVHDFYSMYVTHDIIKLEVTTNALTVVEEEQNERKEV